MSLSLEASDPLRSQGAGVKRTRAHKRGSVSVGRIRDVEKPKVHRSVMLRDSKCSIATPVKGLWTLQARTRDLFLPNAKCAPNTGGKLHLDVHFLLSFPEHLH